VATWLLAAPLTRITSRLEYGVFRARWPLDPGKRVEDDRAKVAEEEARLNELRARSRAGKERLARISAERTLQE
jgi:hypothetical protein